MTIEVLLSCLENNPSALFEKANISTDCVIVNQCDEDSERVINKTPNVKVVNSSSRGLSKSRNVALSKATADIGVITDDDVVFFDDYELIIKEAFGHFKDADIIVFDIENWKSSFFEKPKKLNWLYSLKISSIQLVVNIKSIHESGILFDPNLGAGSGNGAGEETKFVYDCFKKGLNIYYYPKAIGTLTDSTSTWFNGYNEKYFFQKGKVLSYIYGRLFAAIYGIYFCCRKYNLYHQSIGIFSALNNYFLGINTQL